MQNTTNILDPLLEKVEEYGKSSLELLKLKMIDKLSIFLANLFANFVLILFFVLFISALNIGLSIWLGKLIGELYLGFFCLAGFYLILGLIYYVFGVRITRKRIKRSVVNVFLK
jgi:hypothetical protein